MVPRKESLGSIYTRTWSGVDSRVTGQSLYEIDLRPSLTYWDENGWPCQMNLVP